MPSTSDLLCYLCSFTNNLVDNINDDSIIMEPKDEYPSGLMSELIATSPRASFGKITRQESFKRGFDSVSNSHDEVSVPSKRENNSSSVKPVEIHRSLSTVMVENMKLLKVTDQSDVPQRLKFNSPLADVQYVKDISLRGGKEKNSTIKPITRAMSDDDSQFLIAGRVARYLRDFQGDIQPSAVFQTDRVLLITLDKYVDRLMRLFNKWAEEANGPDSIGVHCGVLALTYIRRANLRLCSGTIHRCYLGAFLVAVKLLYDFYMSNNFWASVGAVTPREVNAVEAAFCDALHWRFSVGPQEHDEQMAIFGLLN